MVAPRDSLSTRFKKAASRTIARFTGKPLDIDMISTIRMAKTRGARPVGGESLVAYHTQANTWNVYHIGCVDFYPGSDAIIKQHQALGLGLGVTEALDLLSLQSDNAMSAGTERYNHPVQVAKMIGHTFPMPK
jgi:hypothetical protein